MCNEESRCYQRDKILRPVILASDDNLFEKPILG